MAAAPLHKAEPNKYVQMDDALWQYVTHKGYREPEIFQRLRQETVHTFPDRAVMQISPDQGQLMSLLVQIGNFKRVLEVGVFTGYSSLAVALALPEDGVLYACDVSEEWTSVARRYWKEAGVEHKVKLHIRPAVETLRQLLEQPGVTESFDFAFIDADKTSYPQYYELILRLLRKGGVLIVDNVFRGKKVLKPEEERDPDSDAIAKLNDFIAADQRVQHVTLNVSDGITILRKK